MTMRDEVRHYANESIDITYDARRCIHASECVRGLPAVATRVAGSFSTNPDVVRDLGVDTGKLPRDYAINPRFGVTYLIGNVAGVPSGTFRAGIGEFRGRVPSTLASYVAATNGSLQGQGQLVCVGPATPAPDWSSPNDSPTDCVGFTSPSFGTTAPNAAWFTDDFGAPRVWSPTRLT